MVPFTIIPKGHPVKTIKDGFYGFNSAGTKVEAAFNANGQYNCYINSSFPMPPSDVKDSLEEALAWAAVVLSGL